MIQEFIERHFDWLANFLYGKELQIIYVTHEDDYDFALEVRSVVSQECRTPATVKVAAGISHDDGPVEEVKRGKILVLSHRGKGLLLPARVDRTAIEFKG
jgi:hypothetical protein